MGFKLDYDLTGPGAGSQTGTNTISLPYNPRVRLTDAPLGSLPGST